MINTEIERKKVGYARVSTDSQDVENQVRELAKHGIAEEDIYIDEAVSGTVSAMKRNGFKKVMDKIQAGEVSELYVMEISRLGRTQGESITLFIAVEGKGTQVRSLAPNEAWTFTVDVLGMRNVLIAVFTWFSQLERENISKRTKIALQRKKDEGFKLGRREKEPDKKQYDKIKADNSGLKTAQIARIMKVPQATMYRWVARWEEADRIASNKKIIESDNE